MWIWLCWFPNLLYKISVSQCNRRAAGTKLWRCFGSWCARGNTECTVDSFPWSQSVINSTRNWRLDVSFGRRNSLFYPMQEVRPGYYSAHFGPWCFMQTTIFLLLFVWWNLINFVYLLFCAICTYQFLCCSSISFFRFRGTLTKLNSTGCAGLSVLKRTSLKVLCWLVMKMHLKCGLFLTSCQRTNTL